MAQSTISQRIALEGAEEILRQLTALGERGEKSVRQIQDATSGGMSPALAGLSGIAATLRGAFNEAGEALAPARAAFGELERAIAVVRDRALETSRILGIGFVAGLAGGVAGIIELARHSFEGAHQLEVQAEAVGLTVEQLQIYRQVARETGVSAEELFNGLVRASQNVGKEHEKLNESGSKLLSNLVGQLDAAGVAVVHGVEPLGTAIKAHIIGNIADATRGADALIDVLKKIPSNANIPETAFVEARRKILSLAGDMTKAGVDFRASASELVGPGVFQPQTIGEQIKIAAETAKDPVRALGVTLKDLQDAQGSLDPILRKFSEGFARIPDATERSRIGLAIFGRASTELITSLEKGHASIDSLREGFEKTGLIQDKEGVKTAAEAEIAFLRLGFAATQVRNQLATIFAPAITTALNTFTDFIKANAASWVAWGKVIASDVSPKIRELLGLLPETGKEAKKAGEALPDVVSSKTPHGATVAAHGVGVVQIPQTASAPEVFGPPVPTAGLKEDAGILAEIRKQYEEFKKDWGDFFGKLNALLTPLRLVADAINLAFGTNLNAAGAALILLGGRFSGLFAVLRVFSELVLLTLGGLVRFLGGPLGAAFRIALAPIIALVGAIGGVPIALGLLAGAGVIAAVFIFRDEISAAFRKVGDAASDLLKELDPLAERITNRFRGISIDFEPIRLAVIQFAADINKTLDDIGAAIQKKIGDAVTFAANLIKGLGASLLGAGGAGAGGAPGGQIVESGSPGALGLDAGANLNAAGGVAGTGPFGRGPFGTDTIPSWLTPGEFVVRADAVGKYGVGLFHALNSMALPMRGFSLGGMVDAIGEAMVPRTPLMLAAGGPALPGGPTHVLNLTIGNEQFSGLKAPGAVYDNLSRHARASALRSAGRKPGWYSS